MGECYYDGVGCTQDFTLARQYNEMSLQQNYPLAILAQYRDTLPPYSKQADIQAAKDQAIVMAEEENDVFAMFQLGVSKVSTKMQGMNCLEKACQAGHISAMFCLAVTHRNLENFKSPSSSVPLANFQEGARRGHAPSQCGLGGLYDFGKYVQQDHVEAKRWYQMAAENGYAPAQHNLGVFLLKGLGGQQDVPKGIEWLKKAAEQNQGDSAHVIGMKYLNGDGVIADPEEAVKYLTIASLSNHPWGCFRLAECLEKGIGTSINWMRAIELYAKSAQKGVDLAVEKYKLLVIRKKAWKFIRVLWIGWYKDRGHSVISLLPRELIREIAKYIRVK